MVLFLIVVCDWTEIRRGFCRSKSRANYSAHCMPFTKESLFYREIFEKYYHDQSRTIVDFWMPNKAWPGCNVNDPSARVLANYGASGV